MKRQVNINTIAAIVLAMALSACAATGPRYSEQVASAANIPTQSARLTVFRTAERVQYSGRSAAVSVDGKEAGACEYAGFNTFDVPPGSHRLAVDMWDSPGACQLQIEVLGGSTYFYEITPRTANLAAGFPGVIASSFGITGALLGGIATIVGMAAESAGKECGGAFAIVSVEEGIALLKLHSLRKSK